MSDDGRISTERMDRVLAIGIDRPRKAQRLFAQNADRIGGGIHRF